MIQKCEEDERVRREKAAAEAASLKNDAEGPTSNTANTAIVAVDGGSSNSLDFSDASGSSGASGESTSSSQPPSAGSPSLMVVDGESSHTEFDSSDDLAQTLKAKSESVSESK